MAGFVCALYPYDGAAEESFGWYREGEIEKEGVSAKPVNNLFLCYIYTYILVFTPGDSVPDVLFTDFT